MFHLITISKKRKSSNFIPGILDVQRGKLITQNSSVPDINALLEGEAASFTEIWKKI